jgi:purine-nucleoside phosphorylase
MMHRLEDIERVADLVRKRIDLATQVLIITGSGLSTLADEVRDGISIPYREIPDFPPATVEGHPGQLVVGHLEGKPVAVMKGRTHFYEGYSLSEITFPIRVVQALGAKVLIVTNAAGGLNLDFRVGDLMLITDHVNLVGMAGHSPLFGPNDDRLGPRFLDMSDAYDEGLRRVALGVGKDLGLKLREGVYVMLGGPTFESPADICYLRLIGADAVGMSTVPEVVVARHGGMRVLGISHISNIALAHEAQGEELHEEVLEAGSRAVPRLSALIKGVLKKT